MCAVYALLEHAYKGLVGSSYQLKHKEACFLTKVPVSLICNQPNATSATLVPAWPNHRSPAATLISSLKPH